METSAFKKHHASFRNNTIAGEEVQLFHKKRKEKNNPCKFPYLIQNLKIGIVCFGCFKLSQDDVQIQDLRAVPGKFDVSRH